MEIEYIEELRRYYKKNNEDDELVKYNNYINIYNIKTFEEPSLDNKDYYMWDTFKTPKKKFIYKPKETPLFIDNPKSRKNKKNY